MSKVTQPGASTGGKPGRVVGPYEAAAERLREAVGKVPVGEAVLGLADSGVHLGRELDGWDWDVPGRAATLQEYGRATREIAKYASGEVVADDGTFDRLKALVRTGGGEPDGSGT